VARSSDRLTQVGQDAWVGLVRLRRLAAEAVEPSALRHLLEDLPVDPDQLPDQHKLGRRPQQQAGRRNDVVAEVGQLVTGNIEVFAGQVLAPAVGVGVDRLAADDGGDRTVW
jgi:hypothetical protein